MTIDLGGDPVVRLIAAAGLLSMVLAASLLVWLVQSVTDEKAGVTLRQRK